MPGREREIPQGRPAVAFRTILLLLLVEWLLLVVFVRPLALDLRLFGFYDPGAALRGDALLAEGLRPGVDFAYSYGLLPLEIGRGWFAAFGRTPWAYDALTRIFQGLMVVGLARLGGALKWDRRAVLVVMAGLPYAAAPFYPNQTHAMEAMLLVWALDQQVRGRHWAALALVTAGAFVKPSMSYVFGMILVGIISARWERGKGRWGSAARDLGPALALALILAVGLGAVFGWPSLCRTLVPLQAGKSYEAARFGLIFGVGKQWIWPPGVGLGGLLRHWFLEEAGFWMAATVTTMVAGATVIWTAVRKRDAAAASVCRPQGTPLPGRVDLMRAELIITVGVLYGVFLLGFYAWPGSWRYYAYLVVLGAVTAVSLWQRRGCWITALLVALAIAGQATQVGVAGWGWLHKEHGPATAGLWTKDPFRTEWEKARADILRDGAGERRALLLTNGYVEGLFPEVRGAVVKSWWMSPGLALPGEMERIRAQVRGSAVVVRFSEAGRLDPWWDEGLTDERGDFEEAWRGTYFTVMRRTHAPATGPSEPAPDTKPRAD